MNRFFSPSSFAAGIIVGALLGYAWSLSEEAFPGLEFAKGEQSALNLDAVYKSQSGTVAVADQAAGDMVVIESITVPPPGVWVTVREVRASELSNVLGAARVSGPKTNVSIPLLRATTMGQRYAVQLYRDNGDGHFDLATDSVYVDLDTGERVVTYFWTK